MLHKYKNNSVSNSKKNFFFVDCDITMARAITSAQFKTPCNQAKCDNDIAI